jgi:hypothetical protein
MMKWWTDWPINGEESTHINGRCRMAEPSDLGTSDRWMTASYPLDNRGRERTDPRHRTGELL